MIRRSSVALMVLSLALAALPAIASAQQTPVIVRPYPRVDLVSTTRQLANQAAQEAPSGQFARAAERLAREAQQAQYANDYSRFEGTYVRMRRLVMRGDRFSPEPSDALLDAWDRVVASYTPLRYGTPAPLPPPPRPPPAPGADHLEGSFERMPVRLYGRTLEELEASCMQFTSAIDTSAVDDVTIGATRVHNGPSYWDARALCSMVVLNSSSRLYHVSSVQGSIEGIPFHVGGSRDVIDRVLRTHLPRLLRGMQVDDVVVNGRSYRNSLAYWSTEQILALVGSQLAPGPYAYYEQPALW
jgi:hypothetical protein